MAISHRSPIEMNQLEIRQLVMHLLSSDPSSPVEGQMYYNTVTHTVEFYNGTAWIVLGTLDQVSKAAADVDLNSHKITNLATPSSSGDAASRGYVLGLKITDLTAPSADFSMNSHKITNVTDPGSAQDAATKAYVDSVATGITSWKQAVRVATTANGTLASAYENGDTVDGVTLATGDRILIKDQTAGAENGIYVVAASGAPTRATDSDSAAEIRGAGVFVEEGTANADTGWIMTTNAAITLNTTALVFVQFTSLGQITAGTGLTKSGSTLNVGAGAGINVAADTVLTDPTVIPTAFAADIGDGSTTSIVVTHNLGSKDVIVAVYDKTTPFAEQICEVRHTSTTTITLVFAVAPTSAQYRVTVVCLHG